MSEAQGEGMSELSGWPRLRDLAWCLPMATSAIWQLMQSRLAFRHFHPRFINEGNLRFGTLKPANNPADMQKLQRIAYVLPRVASRLPWRSDCLIQAIAGQNWLGKNGIASEVQIGVDLPKQNALDAHAWLVSGDQIITGGDISRYSKILAMDPDEANSNRKPMPDDHSPDS